MAGRTKRTLQVLEVLSFLLVIHFNAVVENDQRAATEQVSDVAGEHCVDSRALQPVEGLLVHGRVHVVELLHVMRAADEQADGAVARLRLPVRVTPGLLIGRVGLKPALEASSVGVSVKSCEG